MSHHLLSMTAAFRIEDAVALWQAAAMRAQTMFGMHVDDIVETIGPREDPQIQDCLLLLLQASVPGCVLQSLDCDRIDGPKPHGSDPHRGRSLEQALVASDPVPAPPRPPFCAKFTARTGLSVAA